MGSTEVEGSDLLSILSIEWIAAGAEVESSSALSMVGEEEGQRVSGKSRSEERVQGYQVRLFGKVLGDVE
jgi:hypothetical protein